MISFEKLWKLMEKRNVSQYVLIKSGISHSTLTRLKRNENIQTETIDKLCRLLECKVEDIMEYID